MTVKVIDLQHVEIEGESVGCVADAMANFRDRAGDIQAALVEWSKGFAETAAIEARASLQEALDKVTGDLEAAIGRSDRLTAQLASQQQAYTADCNNLKAAHEASLKLLEDEAVSQIGKLNESLRRANADLEFHQQRANIATALVNHLSSGNGPAAVAVSLELRRLELSGRQAQLDAEMKALQQPAA